jgi:hypothetical protein
LFLPVGRLSTPVPLTFVVTASNLADDFSMPMTHNTLLESSAPDERRLRPNGALPMVVEFWGAAV